MWEGCQRWSVVGPVLLLLRSYIVVVAVCLSLFSYVLYLPFFWLVFVRKTMSPPSSCLPTGLVMLQEIDELKQKLAQMKEEQERFANLQREAERDMQAVAGESKEEVDARSIYVGNVECISRPLNFAVALSLSFSPSPAVHSCCCVLIHALLTHSLFYPPSSWECWYICVCLVFFGSCVCVYVSMCLFFVCRRTV